jgi:RNA polymerase-binding transcription factor DksA
MDLHRELTAVKDRLHVLRDEMSRTRQQLGLYSPAATELDTRMEDADRSIARIEAGLYPSCRSCGERIEIEILQHDPLAAHCATCARHAEVPAKGRR